ncbi:hypothetical protein FLW53_05910 [Microbispora sp. SCL1-1]|uniref:hypothetical protein n=1 Tax=unclassified Microbispora TaxID=2614687 RepID=UPI001156D509|nr:MULTISPECIES: hypothetical protein [unclassified Microbispora]NJP23747.1 hypothetical protein [Microbispora sp. CL1-1]TQS15951.1 hypothetical protein FLW53_05910 [Microbispora sp. SCL1-1]
MAWTRPLTAQTGTSAGYRGTENANHSSPTSASPSAAGEAAAIDVPSGAPAPVTVGVACSV